MTAIFYQTSPTTGILVYQGKFDSSDFFVGNVPSTVTIKWGDQTREKCPYTNGSIEIIKGPLPADGQIVEVS